MNAGHRALRDVLWPTGLLALTAALIAVLITVTSAAATPAAPHKALLTSLTLTSVGSDGKPADAPSTRADVAANGSYVAFQSRAPLNVTSSVPQTPISTASSPPPGSAAQAGTPAGDAGQGVSRIYVRDLVAGKTTLLSDVAYGDATGPSISANGKLVSFEQDGNVYVADRQASGSGAYDTPRNLVLRRVTGTPKDLKYEHAVPCPAGLAGQQGRVTPCGPVLSADGSTLVYPAQLTPVSPEMSITATVTEGDDPARAHAAATLSGDMLDFTPFNGDQEGSPGGVATVTYTNNGSTPIAFGDPNITITEPPGSTQNDPYGLDGMSCTGDLAPGSSCTVTVSFDEDICYTNNYVDHLKLVRGDLVTHASTPAGQSVLELTALCSVYQSEGPKHPSAGNGAIGNSAGGNGTTGDGTDSAGENSAALARAAATSQATCPAPPQGLSLVQAPDMTSDNEGAPLTNFGAAEIGRPYVAWMTLQAPESPGMVDVEFQDANGDGCQLRLVNPAKLKLADPLPADAPAACYAGEPLTSVSGAPSPPPSGRPSSSPAPSPSPGPTASQLPASSGSRRASAPATASDAPPLTCTAYLLVYPDAITPGSALLDTVYWSSYGADLFPDTYFTEHGVSHIIVARRDPSGSGKFADSPSTVVSVNGSGTPLPGASEPSVSADGTYVGFAAPVPIGGIGQGPPPGGQGRDVIGQQTAAGATQVWLHNTGNPSSGGKLSGDGGDGSKPGSTTLVSCLPRLRAGPCIPAANADSPSVSGDGQQVAFATTAAVIPTNDYPGTGTSPSQAAGQVSPDQVYVRSVNAGTTVLISARPSASRKSSATGKPSASGKPSANGKQASRQPVAGGTPGPSPTGTGPPGTSPAGGNAASFAPVITQDGTAVAYVSLATNLTHAQVTAGTMNLYLRAVSGGAAASEFVSASGTSLPAGTAVGVPSVDAHGRLATFPATGALTAGAPPIVASVYTFERFSRLTASPAKASFGRVLIDSGTHVLILTVTNKGPGPGTVTGVQATSPFGVSTDTCTGVVLYHGSQCAVTLTFAPVSPGSAAGTLAVTTDDDGEPPVGASTDTTATVPAPRLTASPDVASAGDATEIRGTSFPPSQTIQLSWNPGLGTAQAVTSSAGTFNTAMVIFPNDFVGPRTLIANLVAPRHHGHGKHGKHSASPLGTEAFLVQPSSVEPPFTSASTLGP